MPGLKSLISYLQLRFRPLPWLVLPVVYFFFSINNIELFSIFKLFYAYIFLLAYRLFDDLMCIPFDTHHKEKRFYYEQAPKKELIIFSGLIFLILMSSIYFTFNEAVLFLHIGLTLISFSLYRAFVHSRYILGVSLIKYPVLLYSLGNGENESIIWGGVILGILIIKELMDEKIIKNINKIKYSVILLALIIKGIEWSK